MNRKIWGIFIPVILTVISVGILLSYDIPASVKNGIILGVAVALLQSLLSVGAMNWAFERTFFYWVWGGGFLFRLLVFSVVAMFVFKMAEFHFAATLISLALATMLFLVTESAMFFWRKSK